MCKLCTIYCCLLENLSFEFEEGESNCIGVGTIYAFLYIFMWLIKCKVANSVCVSLNSVAIEYKPLQYQFIPIQYHALIFFTPLISHSS